MDRDIIYNEADVDDLISDIHQLIDEQEPAQTPDAPETAPAEPAAEEAPAPGPAAEPVPEPEAEPEPETEPEAEPAPEPPFQQQRWTERQKVPKHVARRLQNQEEAYAQWLKEQEEKGEEPPPVFEEEQPPKKKKREKRAKQPDPVPETPQDEAQVCVAQKKKRRVLPWLCLLLVLLTAAIAVLTVFAVPVQPMAPSEHIHAAGTSTVLLAGTDASYGRTPMLMLLTLDTAKGRLALVSLPGDTLIAEGDGAVKLKAVYGLAGGGRKGIAALEEAVSTCVGFVPDGTLVLHPEALTAFVDCLGGVSFGGEALSGETALERLTARDDTVLTDMAQLQTQRQFLAALIGQCRSAGAMLKAPLLLDAICENAVTDMTTENLLWLARASLAADSANAATVTLPGSDGELGGYLPDAELTVQTVNAYCDPYIRAISDSDLDIFAPGE